MKYIFDHRIGTSISINNINFLLCPKNASTTLKETVGAERIMYSDDADFIFLVRDPYERFISGVFTNIVNRTQLKFKDTDNSPKDADYMATFYSVIPGMIDDHKPMEIDEHTNRQVDFLPENYMKKTNIKYYKLNDFTLENILNMEVKHINSQKTKPLFVEISSMVKDYMFLFLEEKFRKTYAMDQLLYDNAE